MSANTTSSSGLSVALGVLGALAGFAIVTILLQNVAGGKPVDPTSTERLKKKEDVAKEQAALIEKYGLASNADAVFAKASEQIKARKVSTTTVAVPGSPTALKQAAAAAPAPAPAPAAPTPPAPAAPQK